MQPIWCTQMDVAHAYRTNKNGENNHLIIEYISHLFFNNLAPPSTSEPPPGERTLPCLATEVAEDGVDEVVLADDVQNQSNLRHLDHSASF